jgi:hypothetical protein
MKSRHSFELGIILIGIGAAMWFAGQYINSNSWRAIAFGGLGDLMLYGGPIIAILGVLALGVGIGQMYYDKTTAVNTILTPSTLLADEKAQIKYCGYCGTANPIDYAYCTKCEKKLSQ